MNKKKLLEKLIKLERDIKLVNINEHQYTSKEQIDIINNILNEMLQLVKTNDERTKINKYSTLSRIVIDQWPYNSSLGKRLIEIENEFNLFFR